jgi:cell division protein FtsL
MRLNLLIGLTVLASAAYLVTIQYESRRLFAEINKAEQESRRLEAEYERLQVEKRAQATPGRIEKIARDQLQMRSNNPAITHYVSAPLPVLGAAAVTAVSAVASGSSPNSAKPMAQGRVQ